MDTEQKLLQLLREQEGFLSGQELGRQLGISRSGIWKGIQRLRSLGYPIEAVNHRGYSLTDKSMRYNRIDLSVNLGTHRLGKEILFLEDTDSTNIQARRLAQAGKPEGTVVVAEAQEQGRGRRTRQWSSPKGTGIWMSVLLRPNVEPVQAPVLTLLAAVAVCRAIRNHTDLPAKIKWPNDLVLHGKKICGILTELSGELETVYSIVIGIGVNVNRTEFPPDLQETATSLCIENKGQPIERVPLFQKILRELESIYECYLEEGFFPFFDEYTRLCDTLGKPVRVLGKDSFCGIAEKITPFGELVVRRDNGEQEIVFSGEVSIRTIS